MNHARFSEKQIALLHGFVIFLGAFLLFLLQPMVGKAILPWFGGGASVWTSCLVFFQIALLFGYIYAYLLGQRLRRNGLYLHLFLIILALALMPILPSAYWKPESVEFPAMKILVLLGATIGLPFIVLASTSPLIQKWLFEDCPGINPFRFYALSNVGSLLALCAYPVIIEPWLSLRAQSYLWSALFLVYGMTMAVLAIRKLRNPISIIACDETKQTETSAFPVLKFSFWALLACLPSALLVSITTHMTTNIAPIPFLWVQPLGIYLITFILCFDHPRWYWRRGYLWVFYPAIAVMALLVAEQRNSLTPWESIPVFSICFFIACMVAHGELAALKPAPVDLTRFYIAIALGGCLGGGFSNIVAPAIFRSRYELPLIFMGFALLPLISAFEKWKATQVPAWARIMLGSAAGITMTLSGTVLFQQWCAVKESRTALRNFYGSLMVVDEGTGEDRLRTLIDGTIDHGSQFQHPSRKSRITTYFSPVSGVGRVFQALDPAPRKVGIIGLGAGTLASYGRMGDEFHFFEINPQVVEIARNDFGFLSGNQATTRVFLGDARITLEGLPPQGYQVFVVDAFSSDMIPVHLLTQEAFNEYARHLGKGGVLVVHVSNRYLDLAPIVLHASENLGKEAWVIKSHENLAQGIAAATWVVVTDRRDPAPGIKQLQAETVDRWSVSRRIAWTDDHSSLFPVLRF